MPVVDPSKRGIDVPPQNIAAEESVLGAMLVSERALKRVRVDSGLTPKHFYLERHREIFSAICRVVERDGTADELLVSAELPAHKLAISEMAAKVPAAGNVLHYARIVLVDAQLRAKLEGSQLIQQGVRECHDEERSAELIREGLQLAASDFTAEAEPTSGDEILDEFFDFLDGDEDPEVFELPWPKLNESVLGGFRRKQMSVLAGWPKMGKSFILDQILAAFSKQGKKTAIFAPEVSRMERAARNLTMRTGVPTEKLLRKQLTASDHRRLAQAREEGLPFDYFEAAGWGADRIAERIIYGGYDIVAIDPVTKIPGFEKTEVASWVSGRFTEIATRANCHVILVSHLNKSRGSSPTGVRPRPSAVDLRGSGMLEGDAHAIIFLHREQDQKANVLPAGELYIDRSRLGPPRSIPVMQFARTLTFHHTDEPVHEQATLDLGKTNAHDQWRDD